MNSNSSIDILKLSLVELKELLKGLRNIRVATRRTGKAGLTYSQQSSNTHAVRVELPIGTSNDAVAPLLVKLRVTENHSVEYRVNPKLKAGTRIFIGDSLYDGSFSTLTQKI